MENNVKKVNLFILADTLEVYGGAERHVLDLVKNLDKEKYNLFVSSLIPGGELLKEIISNGACVRLFPVKRIYSLSGIIRGFEFRSFLKKNKIDILMTVHFGSDVWGTIFGRLAGVPFIISNRRDIGFWKKTRHKIAYRVIDRWVDKIIVNSDSGRNAIMKDEGAAPAKINVIHGAVDILNFKPDKERSEIRKSLGIGESEISVCAIGNFNPIKGHTYLVEAFEHIAGEFPNARLLLVGDGPLMDNLQSMAHSRLLDKKVTFLGARTDIPDILSASDICVLPSLSEGLSNALMEYMTAGKPIVATKVGGNPELIENGVTGILIEPANPADLGNAIADLIKNKEKRSFLARNAREKAEKELSMPSLINRYDSVLSGNRKKKILHLISSNGLFGAEKVLLDIVKAGKEGGDDSVIGAIRNSHNPHIEVMREAYKMGFKTAVFDSDGRVDFGAVLSVRRYIRKESVDIIHSHNYKSDIISFLSSRFTKTKWIATNHVWHGTERKLRLYERLDAFILRFADKVIAVSDEIRNDLVKKGISSGRAEVIYNGICTSAVRSLQPSAREDVKKEFGIGAKDLVITNIGRLSPEKGHKILIEAAKKIIEEKNFVKFLMVGNGPLIDSLRSMVHGQQLDDKVIFTGLRSDIDCILSISDIYVNSSYIEGLPVTVLEAMRARVPVIASKVGALPQIISHEVSGLLVDPGNAEQLKEAIIRLIDSAQARKILAERAYLDVRRYFSLEEMGNNYAEAYQEVLR
ncbi:MAG: glycosyltransferase [Candidatus Omnitrophota bacterium]